MTKQEMSEKTVQKYRFEDLAELYLDKDQQVEFDDELDSQSDSEKDDSEDRESTGLLPGYTADGLRIRSQKS